MKIFVINLDKCKERLGFMSRQLQTMGIDFERVPAVYGKHLSAMERKRDYAYLRSILAIGRKLQDGEIGCSLSHISVYRKMRTEGVNKAVVLEDDVVLSDKFKIVIDKICGEMSESSPQVVLLSAHGVKDRKSDFEKERISSGMCTDGYVINLAAANLILDANYPVVVVADKWHRWVSRNGLELFRAWPTTVQQDNGRFGTEVNEILSSSRHGVRLLMWKFIRLIEVFADWLWYVVARK